MAPPPAYSISSHLFRASLQESVKKKNSVIENVIKKFRPKKSERLSYVFLSSKGERLKSTTKRKGILVYITGKGKKQFVGKDEKTFVKNGKKYRTKVKLLEKISNIPIAKLRKKKKAFKKLISMEEINFRTTPYTVKRNKPKDFDWMKAYPKIQKECRKYSNPHFAQELDIRVLTNKGRIFEADGIVIRYFEILPRTTDHFGKILWNRISMALDDENAVSKGSANFIKKLPLNRGKTKAEWRIETEGLSGQKIKGRWGKENNDVVQIEKMEIMIKKLKPNFG